MLKGSLPCWERRALWVLAAMGHGDDLALVDRNFPATEVASRTGDRAPRPAGRGGRHHRRARHLLPPPHRRLRGRSDPADGGRGRAGYSAGGPPEVLAEARAAEGRELPLHARTPRLLRRRARSVRGHPDHREPPLRLFPRPQGRRLRLRAPLSRRRRRRHPPPGVMLLRSVRERRHEALSRKIAEVLERARPTSACYTRTTFGHWEKIETLARDIYGAAEVNRPRRRTDPERQSRTS